VESNQGVERTPFFYFMLGPFLLKLCLELEVLMNWSFLLGCRRLSGEPGRSTRRKKWGSKRGRQGKTSEKVVCVRIFNLGRFLVMFPLAKRCTQCTSLGCALFVMPALL